MIIPTKLYNDTIELFFNEDKHVYYVGDQKVPSVTKILSVINKPALINWAANQSVEFISSQIKPGVIYDELQLKAIFDLGKKAHTQRKQDAADIGTFVHSWIEQFILGKNPEMPINEDLQNAVKKFLKWQSDYGVKFLLSEEVIYSKEHNYSGTLDFVAKIDGKLVLGDIKTSSGIWDEYWLQVAAYQCAREEEFPSEKYDYRGIIRIGKDGAFEWKVSEDYQTHIQAFLSARTLYETLERMKEEKNRIYA